MPNIKKLSNSHTFKLKIELQDAPVKITRKVLISEDINMLQCHLIIQEAMGWYHAHLFEFSDRTPGKEAIRIGQPDGFDDEDVKPAHGINLSELQKLSPDYFMYWYDFGDDWWHKITFQKPTKKDQELLIKKGKPFICTDAHGACPPEDVGGVWGYSEFLEAINNPKHPEYESHREWMELEAGESFDPDEVDIEEINDLLFAIKKSHDWNSKAVDLF